MADISSNIRDLEAAFTGEGLRDALLHALQAVERIHRRNWWETNPYINNQSNESAEEEVNNG